MRTNVFIAAIAFYGMIIGQAYAYLDPGTGSIIVQGIIGAIAGALVVGRMYWYKLKGFFSRAKADAPELGADRSK